MDSLLRDKLRGWFAALTLFLLAALVMGCGGSGGGDVLAPVTGGGGSGAPTALTADNSLYVLQLADAFFLPATPAYLLQYPKTATGTPNPATSITSQSQILFGGIAMDSSGKLYVSAAPAAALNQTEILVYQVGATGQAAPIESYPTPESGLSTFNVGLDGHVYLAAGNQIWETSAGAVVRTIQGPEQELTSANDLYDPKAIAADATGVLYAVNGDVLQQGSNPVLIYAAGASGKVLPSATIEGSKTGFTTASSVALDHAGNIYVGSPTAVLVFAPGTTGNVAPTRTIQGSATLLNGILDLKVDASGTVFVLTSSGMDSQEVLGFAPGATGNVAPTTVLGPQVLREDVKQTFGGIAVM